MKNTQLNEKQVAIINTLKGADKPMTLAEISAEVNFVVRSGTTNSLVKRGIIEAVGERVTVCPTCGRKTTVKEYVYKGGDENISA